MQAQVLTLDAPISATGGAGGNDYVEPGTYKASANIDIPKNGGAGGTIRVLLPHPIAALTPFLQVGSGAPGVVCDAADSADSEVSCGARTYGAGTAGPAGHVVLGALTPAQVAMLPSLPAPLTSYLGAPPAALPPLRCPRCRRRRLRAAWPAAPGTWTSARAPRDASRAITLTRMSASTTVERSSPVRACVCARGRSW